MQIKKFSNFSKTHINQSNNLNVEYILKKVMQNTIIGESIISMVFTTFGLVGSYRENYCCVAIFAVYMTLSIIAEIYLSLLASGFWFTTIIYLFITIISYSFARQIRQRLIAIALQPQTAFMRDYGQTFGLQYNSPQYSANNNVLQFQTLEVNGRYLPPYYNTRHNSIHFEPTLSTVAELPANPPPYEENDTNPKKVAQSFGHNNV